MKAIIKGEEPARLARYRQKNPAGTWEQFCTVKKRKAAVQQMLRVDQGGICAYCEIDLRERDQQGEADFRVEHFHPKSDKASGHNWALDWDNLLACCHGGSRPDVSEAKERFEEIHALRTCDVLKADHNWDTNVLNPLHLPADVCVFTCPRTSGGKLTLSQQAHDDDRIDNQRAQQTLDWHNLNAMRLSNLRAAVLNKLNDDLREKITEGMTIAKARADLARRHLRQDQDGNWPAFFSAIRSYLGREAELHLQSIGFFG